MIDLCSLCRRRRRCSGSNLSTSVLTGRVKNFEHPSIIPCVYPGCDLGSSQPWRSALDSDWGDIVSFSAQILGFNRAASILQHSGRLFDRCSALQPPVTWPGRTLFLASPGWHSGLGAPACHPGFGIYHLFLAVIIGLGVLSGIPPVV